jgi:putative salt-induced outer membrane protein YdiY
MEVLQTSALPRGYGADRLFRGLPAHPRPRAGEGKLERETGFEPATSTLARSHSTTELFPLAAKTQRTTRIFDQSRQAPRPGEAGTHSVDLRARRSFGEGGKVRAANGGVGRGFATLLLMIRLATLVCALTLVTALPARADEVRLKNGDRITGVMVSMAGGTLLFKAPGGDLTIPWSDVTSLSVDSAVFVTVATNPPILTAIEAGSAPGNANLQPGGPVDLADIVAITLRRPGWVVTGGAGAGVVQTSGNTQVNNVRVAGDFMAKGAANRYTASAAATNGSDHGVETARNWSATGKYDRFLTSRLYANANAVFTNDRFRDLDLRTALGAGLGLQLIDTARVKLTGGGGVGWVNENFRSIPDDSYQAAYESAGLQIELVPRLAQLFHSHDGYFQISRGDKMFIRSQQGIRFSIAAGFVTTIEEDVDYDRHPSPGRAQQDRTFSLTLGYRF